MGRTARAYAGILIVIAGTTSVLVGTAAAAPGCEEKVLLDWSDNGRVDGMYPLHCYQSAIETMPTDLRDYTNAGDAIRRALTRAAAKDSAGRNQTHELAAGSNAPVTLAEPWAIPLPLVALAGVSTGILAAGGLGWVARRRRSRYEA
jgi:hypothetical protein